MAPRNELPPRALVVQLLRYDARTGDLIWLHRPREFFQNDHHCNVWNAKYAGKIAGCRSHTYRVVGIFDVLYAAHRVAWLIERGEPVPYEIDHVDDDPLNNRINNLEEITHSRNIAKGYARRS
jgi:hypothetical protein